MFLRPFPKPGDATWIMQKFLQNAGQRRSVPVGKSQTTRTNSLRQSPLFRPNHDASTSQRFQCDNPEGFRPARWNNKNSVGIQSCRQLRACLTTNESDGGSQSLTFCFLLEGRAFGTIAHDRQPRLHPRLQQNGECVDQHISAFVGDEASHENQIARSIVISGFPKNVVVKRISDVAGWNGQFVSNGTADRKICGMAQDGEFETMRPGGAVRLMADPRLVSDEKPAPKKQQGPERAQRNIILQKYCAPLHLSDQFSRPWSPNHWERKASRAFRLRDHSHVVSECNEFASQQIGYCFDPTGARKKVVGPKQYLQSSRSTG